MHSSVKRELCGTLRRCVFNHGPGVLDAKKWDAGTLLLLLIIVLRRLPLQESRGFEIRNASCLDCDPCGWNHVAGKPTEIVRFPVPLINP